ncbi:MAG: hypothetical protein NC082_00500 [Clostridiales bacterium]|nr:hypothetical protein [Clostridiales bacterium]
MVKKILFFTMLSVSMSVFAYEPTDTIKTQELKEVVIEASNQKTNVEVSTYIPMARQKNSAQNAVALLSQMSIPQIDVDPINLAVKTAHGQDVSIFIDYIPATSADLQGMKTQDVKKVEYYTHPSDARFQGAKYVINFVMQKYEWGGYTKLTADKWFGVNRTEGSLYSKMTYKRMTFDVFANEIYLTNRHKGQSSTEHFNFTDFNGAGPMSVTRNSDAKASLYRNNSNDFSVRALYNTENIQISNRISYSLTNIPHNDLTNSLSYSSDRFPASESSTISSSKDWALNYVGGYFFMLSKQVALNVDATYTYGRNSSNSNFRIPDGLSIINNAKEDVHKFTTYLHLTWNPNKSNRFFSNFGVQHDWNIINYFGNSPSKQKYDVGIYFLGQNYQHIFNEKWNVGTGLAWIWETNRISGINADNNFPQTNINATWSPNDKNQMYFTANYGSMFPNASQKSPNMLQQDELMWYKGTPELKDYKYTNALLSYTWLPNNRWQLTADAYFGYIKDRCVTLYSPTGPDGAMLRQYFNGGDYFSDYIGINATGKFFGGKLVAKLRPQFWVRKTTGDYAWRNNQLTCTAQLTYYFGNFYLWGYYMTPSKYQENHSGVISRTPSKYLIQIGWGKGAWNINASAYNFFHTSWEDYKETLSSEYYSFDRTAFGTQHHSRYSVSVTYTIGYGKKVQRNNEISGSGTAGSAILK